MSYIGKIIKELRCELGINRKDLSENICTEKYVYLIEKGERTPSVDMVRLFGNRLGVDLFDYYKYLDCNNPLEVRKFIKLFEMYHRKSDYVTLKEVTAAALELPDFHHKPWSFEVKLNNLCSMAYVENKYNEVITYINKVMKEMGPKYSKSLNAANFYILLSSCYQIMGDLDNARLAVLSAQEIIRDKLKIEEYEQTIITVRISHMTINYLLEEFDEAIGIGNELLRYQSKINSYERIHYVCFYLAFSYYKLGEFNESFIFFEKGIYLLMFDYKPMDAYYITIQDIFEELANDNRIDQKLVCEFKKRYDIK